MRSLSGKERAERSRHERAGSRPAPTGAGAGQRFLELHNHCLEVLVSIAPVRIDDGVNAAGRRGELPGAAQAAPDPVAGNRSRTAPRAHPQPQPAREVRPGPGDHLDAQVSRPPATAFPAHASPIRRSGDRLGCHLFGGRRPTVKPTGENGLWRASPSGWLGRPSSSYARGSRACASGDDCWADRSAWSLVSIRFDWPFRLAADGRSSLVAKSGTASRVPGQYIQSAFLHVKGGTRKLFDRTSGSLLTLPLRRCVC